jgi:secreted trypsin-like serine protease
MFLLLYFLISNFQPAHAIIGGKEIDNSDTLSSHVVAMQMEEKQPDGTIVYYKGTGVLVSDRVIMTAGHNFFYISRTDSGEAIFSTSPKWGKASTGEKRIRVKRAEVYPKFIQNKTGTEDDLALILLQSPVPENYTALPLADLQSIPLTTKTSGMVLGYGQSKEFEHHSSDNDFRLRKATLNFVRYSDSPPNQSKKIWFDQSENGFCAGDSGGPILISKYGNLTIYGIATHTGFNTKGKMSCLTEGAFTNIAHYRDWIDKTLKSFSNH